MHTRNSLALVALFGLIFPAAHPAGAEESRQLGAHVHGQGTLNIAIEGHRVVMQLDTPGADIVGFEHAANTPEAKAALERAKAALATPLTLFRLPAEAQCKALESKVEIEGGPDDKDAAKDKAAGGHMDFNAEYTLECAAPARLTAIEFDFFARFPASQALDVVVVTAKGQASYKVRRDKPRLDLGGLT